MPEVFNVDARPWINADAAWTPEAVDLLIDVVGKCPSGALKMERPEQLPRATADQIEVTKNEQSNRYEVRLDGELAGYAEYMLTNGLITFTHTEIDPAFEGRGAASALIRWALDDVTENHADRKVLPLCPFVKGWIMRHPEYAGLLFA